MRLVEHLVRSLGAAVRWRHELTQLVGHGSVTLVVVGSGRALGSSVLGVPLLSLLVSVTCPFPSTSVL